MQRYYRRALPMLGHMLAGVAAEAAELAALYQSQRLNLVLAHFSAVDDDSLVTLSEVLEIGPVAVLVVFPRSPGRLSDSRVFEQIFDGRTFDCLARPVKRARLAAAIPVALNCFRVTQALHDDRMAAQQALENRKIVEQAKGILMRRSDLDEPEAYRRLQKLSSIQHHTLVELSRRIIVADQALQAEPSPHANAARWQVSR